MMVCLRWRCPRAAFAHFVTTWRNTSLREPLSVAAGNGHQRVVTDLAVIRYSVRIKDSGFKVRKCNLGQESRSEVAATFRKFQQGDVKYYRVEFPFSANIKITSKRRCSSSWLCCTRTPLPHSMNFAYATAITLTRCWSTFDRETQFYIAYLEYMRMLGRAGLRFCYPRVSAADKEVHSKEGFDLALATKLMDSKVPVVCNDFHLTGNERIFVVSGPNQGGKTTFARSFSDNYTTLANLGCPVPGGCRLFLFNSMFTHFEREENIQNLHGKLQDDLIRIHRFLEKATPRSIIIVNEIFSSTTLNDAVFLAHKVMERIIELDLLCVCVTFLEELASLSEKMVQVHLPAQHRAGTADDAVRNVRPGPDIPCQCLRGNIHALQAGGRCRDEQREVR